MKIVRELIDPIVANAVAKRKDLDKVANATVHEKTLLEDLASSTDGNVFPYPLDYLSIRISITSLQCRSYFLLRDEIMSLLVAGRDTVRKPPGLFS